MHSIPCALGALSLGLSLLAFDLGAATPPALSSPNADPETPLGPAYSGPLAGSAAVSAGGNASYIIPIELPPGINGLAPGLSVNYNSNLENGTLGLGWFLGGSSSSRITRCPQTFSQNSRVHAVDYSADDRFCLDGHQLLVVEGSYGSPGAVYRTESDSFQRVESREVAGGGPAWFEVRGRNGDIRYYGRREDSRIEAEGSAAVRVWALDEVQDRSGNHYTLHYAEDNDEGSYTLEQILFTGNHITGVAPLHRVDLDYETRPDDFLQYQGGSRVRPHPRRLASIRVSHSGELLYRYDFSYESVGVDNRSRLTRIDHCDETSTCRDPVLLQWWDDGQWNYATSEQLMPYTNMWGDKYNTEAHAYTYIHGSAPRWHDLNGDGTLDYVHAVPDAAGRYSGHATDFEVRLSGASGYRDETWHSTLSHRPDAFTWADLDGDGLTDILSTECIGLACETQQLHTAFSTGSGFAMDTWPLPPRSGTRYYRDMNGDKLLDLVLVAVTRSIPTEYWWLYTYEYGVFVYTNTGDGFGPEQSWIEGIEYPALIDLSGDGLTDVLLGDRYLHVNSGTGLKPALDYGSAGYAGISNYADYNGDGLLDRNTRAPDGTCCMLHFNTGKGFEYGGVATDIPIRDLDGSGLADIYSRTVLDYFDVTEVSLGLAVNERGEYQEDTHSYPEPREFFFQVDDINGDGFPDYALANQRVCHTHSSQGITYDEYCEDATHTLVASSNRPLRLLRSITSGRDVQVEFDYSPLTDHSVYTRGSGSTLPEVDVQDSTFVVRELRRSNGLAGKFTTRYQYEALKRDLGGRGDQAFARITARDIDRNLTTVTDYAQAFPLAGRPQAVELRRSSDNRLLTRTVTNYEVRDSGLGGPVFPYVRERSETTYDMHSGASLSVVRTLNSVDDLGNITLSEEEVTDHGLSITWLTRTASEFERRTDSSWMPGLLQARTVTRWQGGSSSLPGGLSTEYVYHPLTGLLTDIHRLPGRGEGFELHTRLERDASGNAIAETVSGPGLVARTTTTRYDGRQQFPVEVSNALGHQTQLAWDPARGLKLAETDPNGLTTHWEYDGFGRRVRERRPDGTITETGLYLDEGSGIPGSVYYLERISSSAAPVRQFYDQLGRELRTRSRGFHGRHVNRDKRYDQAGRLASVSEPFFDGDAVAWNSMSYDELGRQLELDAADSARSTTSAYSGFDVSTTDAEGRTRVRQLNALGQVVGVIDEEGTGLAMTYDSQGNRVQVIPDVWQGGGNGVRYGYDMLGRLEREEDPDRGVYTYRYDALGMRTAEQSPLMRAAGQEVQYSYDKLGRMTQRREPEGTSRWTYDNTAGGNLGVGKLHRASASGFNRVTQYGQSAFGRLTSTRTKINGVLYKQYRSYDDQGRLVSERYPATEMLRRGLTVDYRYDALGNLERVMDESGTAHYQLLDRDAAGRVTEYWLGDGSVTRQTYAEASGRLAWQQATADGASIQEFVYHYDNIGNMVFRGEEVRGLTESFRYDPLTRLKSARVGGAEFLSTRFDPSGNMLEKSDRGEPYYYATSRLHAVSAIDTATGRDQFDYDGDGNLLGGDNMPAISWSSYGKPIHIQQGNVEYAFSYGPDRRRFQKVRNGLATHYLGQKFERIWHATAEEYRSVIFVEGRPVMLRQEIADGATNLYLHQDHLGSITALTDQSGQVVERYSYGPWGKRRSAEDWKTPVAANQWKMRGFTGHEHLDDVGLIHMNGRVYSPALGRMLSPDPVTQAVENGQNYNRYSYAFNNPLSFTDPSGYASNKKVVLEEVTVYAQAMSAQFVSGSTAALSFGVGQSASTQLDRDVSMHMADQAEVLQLEQDIQNDVIVGTTEEGDLVDSEGNVVSNFDYFVGNFEEWGSNVPEEVQAQLLADITAFGLSGTAVDGLVGGAFSVGIYYDSELGSLGIFFSSGGGVNLVDEAIVAGLELSAAFEGFYAESADTFFGSGIISPSVTTPLPTPTGIGATVGVAFSENGGTIFSSGVSIGAGASTVSVTTKKIVLF